MHYSTSAGQNTISTSQNKVDLDMNPVSHSYHSIYSSKFQDKRDLRIITSSPRRKETSAINSKMDLSDPEIMPSLTGSKRA